MTKGGNDNLTFTTFLEFNETYLEFADKTNFPHFDDSVHNCDCDCILENGSYNQKRADLKDAVFQFPIDLLYSYDETLDETSFRNKYLQDDEDSLTIGPFAIETQIVKSTGGAYAFYQNMTCKNTQIKDNYNNTWVSTTWSVDSLQKDKIIKLLIEQTNAFTQGRNGSDSKNYFFHEVLFDMVGPINN